VRVTHRDQVTQTAKGITIGRRGPKPSRKNGVANMTRDEYRACLKTLGWSARELARQLDRKPYTVGNWFLRYDAPKDVCDWLRLAAWNYVEWLVLNPPPPKP
jgi:hypothetical protein